jgi:hypothetical protein
MFSDLTWQETALKVELKKEAGSSAGEDEELLALSGKHRQARRPGAA